MPSVYYRLLFLLAVVFGQSYQNLRCSKTNECACTKSTTSLNYHCPNLTTVYLHIVEEENKLSMRCIENGFEIPDLPMYNTTEVNIVDCDYLEKIQIMLDQLHLANLDVFQFKSSPPILPNFTLTRAHLAGLETLTVLQMDNDSIDTLEDGAFQDLTNLQMLDLYGNNVREITGALTGLTNLQKLDLSRNAISEISGSAFDDLARLKVLHLWKNSLTRLKNTTFAHLREAYQVELSWNQIEELPSGLFEPMGDLRHIAIASNLLVEIPVDVFSKNKLLELVRLRDNRLETLHVGTFANTPELVHVDLQLNRLSHLPGEIFKNLTKLRVLKLDWNSIDVLPENLFDGLTSLKELTLNSNRISAIPQGLFAGLAELETLELGNNSLTVLETYSFAKLPKLRTLKLQNNEITTIGSAFEPLKSLTVLNLAFNKISSEDMVYQPLNKLINLVQLDMSHNNLQAIEYDFITVKPHIEKLNLAYNNITELLLLDVKSNALINLEHNNITYVDFTKVLSVMKSIKDELSTAELKISHNPIICDCHAYDLINFINGNTDKDLLRLYNIDATSLYCSSPANVAGRNVASLNVRELTCDSKDFYTCPPPCECKLSPHNRSIIVDCSNRGLTIAPSLVPFEPLIYDHWYLSVEHVELHLENNALVRVDGLNATHLYLENNNISEFSRIHPDLKILHLHNNKMQRLSAGDLSDLVALKSLKWLSLHNNPWICDCLTSNFSSTLREKLVKKLIHSNITCWESGRNLIDLTPTDLCKTNTEIIIGLGVGLLVFLLIIAASLALFYRYEHEVKVWLFAHEVFLWFVTESELDKDKTFDAFLCFSHKDEDFIIKHLVPGLEEVQNPYKLCIHERDWMPGEYITTQVAQSVNDSRRTIVVLSQNFLASEWTKMEFRTAHSQSMNEGRTRVIVILYGEVDQNELEDDMKSYLKTNTYLKWGDPCFWKKLRYAMPHKNKFERRPRNKKMENIMVTIDKLDLINSPSTPNANTPPAISGDPLLLKAHPLSFKMNVNKNDAVTPPAESGLVLTHNC